MIFLHRANTKEKIKEAANLGIGIERERPLITPQRQERAESKYDVFDYGSL